MIIGEYRVKFYHFTKYNNYKKQVERRIIDMSKRQLSKLPKCKTTVEIYKDDELIVKATANCHEDDNFCRVVGRYMAINKALSSYKIPEESANIIKNHIKELPSSKRYLNK